MFRNVFIVKAVLFFLGLFTFIPFATCMERVAQDKTSVATKITNRDAPSNALIMSATLGNDKLQVTAERYFAGAITSIVYRGKEYIKTEANRFGVELQSAASFDDLGECYNPTEAGGRYDNRAMSGSSSVLLNSVIEPRKIETTTRMAFWWPPNEKYFSPRGDYCGIRKDIHKPPYQEKLSNFGMHKRVTIETIKVVVNGKEKVLPWLDYRITLDVPDHHTNGEIEAVTGYMPSDFTFHISYDPAHNTSDELVKSKSRGMAMQNLPVILATQDGLNAMGVYAPTSSGQEVSYGDYKFPEDTNKWNCVFHERSMSPGKYFYRCLIAIGTVDEVKSVMKQLNVLYPPPAKNVVH
jgi:hypothetical protein